MISESRYWKQPLLEMADRLEASEAAKKLSEAQLVDIERGIFIGFYSIRKLLDCVTKVTDHTKNMKIEIAWYPNREPVNLMHKDRIGELYDLETVHKELRDLPFICGRIIHSFIFVPVIQEEGGLCGIMFTSDHDKNKKLYELEIATVIDIFRTVGNDWPRNVEMREDDVTGEVDTDVS